MNGSGDKIAIMRFAVRQFRRQPGFTVAVVITLALGIGATSSVFSVLNAVMLRPLPYTNPERLAIVWESNSSLGWPVPGARVQVSIPNYLEWVRAKGELAEFAAFADRDFSLTGVEIPESLRGFRATANLFPLLGTRPQIGRLFYSEEDATGHQVVVLSDSFWRRHFGGSADVVGKHLMLDGESYEIVGVLPPNFEEPPRWGGYQKRPDVWVPMAFTNEEKTDATPHRILYPIARLRSGASVTSAHAEMAALGDEMARRFPERNQGWGINLIPLQAERVSDKVRQSLFILLLAAGMVLLIASFNIGHLILARASGRQKEFAIRASLGASRAQILRQLLAEAGILGGLGGGLGILVSRWTTPLLLSLQSGMVSKVEDVTIDWRVFLFTGSIVLASVLCFGLAPLKMARPERLKPVGGGRRRGLLLASEAALTIILLTASSLLIKSLWKMMDADLGLRVERVLTVRIAAKDPKFFHQLMLRIQALPGVESIGVASNLPMQAIMGGRLRTARMTNKEALGADFRWADPGYFTTLGIPILKGRNFSRTEVAQGNARVAIVDATFAKTLNPSGGVIGMNVISLDWPYCAESCQIIGVSGAIRQIGPENPPRPEIILPGIWNTSTIVVRSAGEVAALGPLIRREVAELDRQQPVGKMELMTTSLAGTTEERRFNLALTSSFAGLALALAGIGVFAVTAFGVSQRTRELAVRVAVGARSSHIVSEVMEGSLPGLVGGAVFGLLVSVPLMASLRHYLYDVAPTDWTAYTVAAMGLIGVAAIALVLPVWRALSVDPALVLRHD
jgi:putative ABC transport system permease protein